MSGSIHVAPQMKHFWQILAIILLALTVPASMCCQVAGGCTSEVCASCPNHDHHEGDEHHAPTDCPSDTISHSQVPAPVMVPLMPMVELADLIRAMIRLQDELATSSESFELPMTTAPPELRTTWHFASRAALPARAPSRRA